MKCLECLQHDCGRHPMAGKPVMAIAGLGCETSMFSPARTEAAAFQPLRGDKILDKYAFLRGSLAGSANWKGALIGHALPGGVVTRDAFEDLSQEICTRLRRIMTESGMQGLWYDIHGAMCVEGMDDSEAELLRRIRNVVGPEVVVSASMDLHGNVSRDLAHQTDLITCYRMAPHEDARETKERACRNLVRVLEGGMVDAARVLPLKAWIPIPVLLPGEQTSTRMKPAKHIYAAVSEVEKVEGVLDAAILVGYCWADEPRNHAVVMVTGKNVRAIKAGAEKLARSFWDAHKDFHFVASTGSLDECVDSALYSNKRPYFISDSGDNPTAGGAGDVTWTLVRLLRRAEFQPRFGPRVVYASIPGREAAEKAAKAGVGNKVSITAGAEVDNLHEGPVALTGMVHSVKYGDKWAEIEVVLEVRNVFVIITKSRKPYHLKQDFFDLDLNLENDFDIVVVKIGYLEPELYDMAAGWKLALTPGGVDQNLPRLGHKRIDRPMWPFDRDIDEPDLRARIIPASNELLHAEGEFSRFRTVR